MPVVLGFIAAGMFFRRRTRESVEQPATRPDTPRTSVSPREGVPDWRSDYYG